MTNNLLPRALKLRPAAKYLGCSPRTLQQLVRRGEIRPRLLTGERRPGLLFPIAELERWLREGAPRAGDGGVSDGQ
jgi:excisionase family DNA binding protein